MSLSDARIFQSKQLLKNYNTKKSAFIDNQRSQIQILCLVNETNEILIHYKCYGGKTDAKTQQNVTVHSAWKLIVWFQESKRIIQDLCFDSAGSQLLVICYDNTLHIIPILWILGANNSSIKTTTSQEIENFYWPFRFDEITSFIVPFSGPHACSNPKTCPNNTNLSNENGSSKSSPERDVAEGESVPVTSKYSPEKINETVLASSLYKKFYVPQEKVKASDVNDERPADETSDNISSSSKKEIGTGGSGDGCEDVSDNNEMKTYDNCPYPLSVVWWTTTKNDVQSQQHRAIIGYSDGTICVVGLTPNCPFIANTSIRDGGVSKMTICRDTIVNSVSLLINSTNRAQWKLLLEQNSIGYTYPDEAPQFSENQTPSQTNHTDSSKLKQRNSEEDWQIILPVPSMSPTDPNSTDKTNESDQENIDPEGKDDLEHDLNLANASQINSNGQSQSSSGGGAGIFPAARARLASLRDLGAKKIGALKLKLIENKIKSTERDRSRHQLTTLACMELPSFQPEILTTASGPYFIVQFLNDTHLLSALHTYSDTLSVHSMDISLIPLNIYKIPKDCSHILITPNIMFTKQLVNAFDLNTEKKEKSKKQQKQSQQQQQQLQKTDNNISNKNVKTDESIMNGENDVNENNKMINSVGVIGCNATALRIGEDSDFKESAVLGLFKLENEAILDIHRVPFHLMEYEQQTATEDLETSQEPDGNAQGAQSGSLQVPKITVQSYVGKYQKGHDDQIKRSNVSMSEQFFDLEDRKVFEHEFPAIELDKCFVVTNQSLYCIELKDHPHIVFLNLVKEGQWKACEEFCKIFSLNYLQCIEYAGDVLLKKKKTTQALLTYNVAKIPPVKTALKLAMFGQNNALMHLCAMALKTVYILKSIHPKNHTIKYLIDNLPEDSYERKQMLAYATKSMKQSKVSSNCGSLCSDFSYERDDTPGDLQMSNSSQFHLSNLLLLTLTEKAIKDKQLMPLWNFLVINKRYHTNMSSVVLCQSGLYSSAVILALNRGAHMDAYGSLVAVTNQEFGWYSEINEILQNLSDPIFMECVIYLQHMSIEYFDCIQKKIDRINQSNLKRLRNQLDPFSAVFRPVVSQLSSNFIESDTNDINKKLIEFCRYLIETFLIIIMKLYTLKNCKESLVNGLSFIYVQHEEKQFAISVENSAMICAGFSHCAAIIDGSCYLWGSNGINCSVNCNSNGESGYEAIPKCLEFISNMGLEVHAVKCGKAHTLILTNNGLYVMGSNQMGQLGIGKDHIQASQPMLIREFDGKNVKLIEAGQYHNAVYADGELYTWGWGIYGQLGHGNVFPEDRPKVVKFFSNKVVRQIALGHAHTLVLCSKKSDTNDTTLYVFGCNIFGQLGTGQQLNETENINRKFLKSLTPIEITIGTERIMQIHTKFFSNFIITKSNKLYTWGASPQLIRLTNQARKRARMAQKFEETKTVMLNDSEVNLVADNGETAARVREENLKNITFGVDKTTGTEAEVDNEIIANEVAAKNLSIIPTDVETNDSSKKFKDFINYASQETNSNDVPTSSNSNPGNCSGSNGNSSTITGAIKNILPSQPKIEAKLKKLLKSKSGKNATNVEELLPDGIEDKINADAPKSTEELFDDEYTDHLYPMAVDTSEVAGEIIQVSSGLYHSALVTSTSRLYTWGKNLEKQLGRESARCDLIAPAHLELNENVLYVDCGSDFTIVLTDHFTIKAFGNNNMGQCGREMTAPNDRNSIAGKLVRLRVSKRVVRLPDTSQCIDQPVDIPLPRPKIRMNFDAVRYLKKVPKFHPKFISREIFNSSNVGNYSSFFSDQDKDSDDDDDSIKSDKKVNGQQCNVSAIHLDSCDSREITSDFIHYCLFIFHGIYDPHKILDSATLSEFKIRILMLNYYVKETFVLCLSAAKSTFAHENDRIVDNSESGAAKNLNVTAEKKEDDQQQQEQQLSEYVIKLFEFFTKDANIVPIHRTDLKHLIHAIFLYFIENSLPINLLEDFFLNNIDHYLFGLAFVLYFNNNNTKLERQVQQKYNHLFSGCDTNNTLHRLICGDGDSSRDGNITETGSGNDCDSANTELTDADGNNKKAIADDATLDFEVIFKNVSTSFKTIICQRLIEFDHDLN